MVIDSVGPVGVTSGEDVLVGVEYDIVPAAVQQTVSQVGSYAGAARSFGGSASADGASLASLCGTAQMVGDALVRLWAQRSQTGVRSGDYAAGCADAVAQACAAISEGDRQMQQTSVASAGVAAAAARFGQQGG